MVYRNCKCNLPEHGLYGNIQSRICSDSFRRPHLQNGLRGDAWLSQSKPRRCDHRMYAGTDRRSEPFRCHDHRRKRKNYRIWRKTGAPEKQPRFYGHLYFQLESIKGISDSPEGSAELWLRKTHSAVLPRQRKTSVCVWVQRLLERCRNSWFLLGS